ncbi:MAG: hypothetical protein EPN91_12870 [Salinibacterium sp.]|nr:MAG: hypothetical protein EPN91_12870 [Salinibacterium sp.]
MTSGIGTTARDVPCPNCCALRSRPCKGMGGGFHRERIRLAALVTRDANQRRKKRETQGP